jgi:hypothetical protein
MRTRLLHATVLCLAGCIGPFDLESGDDALMRTDTTTYTLRETFRGGREVRIPYTYENRTGGRIYLVNCGGYVPPILEQKATGGEWRTAWGAVELTCLSPPVIIEPDAIFRDTLWVLGFPRGGNTSPEFLVDEIEGIHRLRWNRALTSFQNRLPFGEELPLAQRVSNEFLLREP